MTAFLFVAMKVHDTAWMGDYQANVPAIMHRHGGQFVAGAQNIRRYEGDGINPDSIALMTFPSMEAIDAFVSDADYHPYREARRSAASSDALAFAVGE
ncbi:DUF1330 domain-containing protein [Agrobacterium vitis]|uniref:DUF1330 domain-containing protein n=1 Tax=Agrobacterium vitis TaxID=373 RepID=UPI0012E95E08|nr:DUF1330 domain-containing protein [Agrobacterium vitis]MVA18948.1 DUF1330 domain-containing protein [Agrobacterium vitis]